MFMVGDELSICLLDHLQLYHLVESILVYPHPVFLMINILVTMEENNRMGKTRDLFKKIRDTKGTFHAKMGSIKDRNGMDLTEAEDIKKRWQEYTE